MRAVVRNGELRGPLWPGWRGFQRFSRVRSPLKGTAFRLAWRAGYSHPGWSAPSRRYSHSPFGCTAFRPGFFVRARWCSPFECTGFGVARSGIYPHRERSIRVDASDAHRSDSQTFESVDAQMSTSRLRREASGKATCDGLARAAAGLAAVFCRDRRRHSPLKCTVPRVVWSAGYPHRSFRRE